jgi:hypothetical protein
MNDVPGEDAAPLVEAFAEDIAVWARFYAHQDWQKDSPAILNLAHRLARVTEQFGRNAV